MEFKNYFVAFVFYLSSIVSNSRVSCALRVPKKFLSGTEPIYSLELLLSYSNHALQQFRWTVLGAFTVTKLVTYYVL